MDKNTYGLMYLTDNIKPKQTQQDKELGYLKKKIDYKVLDFINSFEP